MIRVSVSAPPPGGNGTTMRTGLEGKAWASAADDATSKTMPTSAQSSPENPWFSLLPLMAPFFPDAGGATAMLNAENTLVNMRIDQTIG
jgi:hypothetical protein